MMITQKRAIERRLPMRDATYAQIAHELSVTVGNVNTVAMEMGHKRLVVERLRFMVRAQDAVLALRKTRRRKYARA